MVADGIAAILPGVRGAARDRTALHPMYAADRACVNTLAQALDLCDLLGDGTGAAIDTYHVWWDPALALQIKRAGDAAHLYRTLQHGVLKSSRSGPSSRRPPRSPFR